MQPASLVILAGDAPTQSSRPVTSRPVSDLSSVGSSTPHTWRGIKWRESLPSLASGSFSCASLVSLSSPSPPGGHGCPGTFMAAGSHLFPTRTDGATAPLSSSAPGFTARATSTKNTMRPRQEERRGGAGAEKAMSGTGAVPGAIADAAPTMECYFCGGAPAVVYCRADSAGLCLPCDRHVHGANRVSCRHARSPLCAVCRAAAATVRRGAARFLCSNCDFEGQQQQHGELTEPLVLLHDRGTVEDYTGCPSVGELAAILGVVVGDGDKVWWPVWEEPQVLTFDDVIMPTTSCHGLQPLLTSSSSPKSRRPPCGELDGEVLRQLGELAKSEEAATTDPACVDQLPPWGSSDYAAIGHADLGALGAEAICAAAILHVPPSQHQEAWIAVDCSEAPEQVSAGSSAEPSLSSFVEVSEVCPGLSRSGSSADDAANAGHDHPPPAAAPVAVQAQAPPAQASKSVGGYDVVYPDRDKVISRYKEKRKNRMFGKQIRYESRKARADGRVRINGRFAKSS